MNAITNAIASRLSLRPPQRESLEILSNVCELIDLKKDTDSKMALEAIRNAYPTVTDFERDFPSLCFALATGVGKTRLMGAFITYLLKAKGVRHFFVLAPNLTIYDKLIKDFTPNTEKYVFQGISEFAVNPPLLITGDNYENGASVQFEREGQLPLSDQIQINVFNISKINSEVRGGKSPRIKRLSEYIGESYFEYLSKLDDLVLLMDESHRYRASAGVRAINELKPILGLELTATPQIEKGNQTEPFKNVIYSYPLSAAMEDGFVKEPAVATRENFDAKGYDPAGLERLKLEDGIRLHENTKVELEVYARENKKPIVKPFVLVIARDVEHASALKELIEDTSFFEGRYRGKAITVHSALQGEEKDEFVQQLISVENPDNPTEVVVHVNMLKEGWDVRNLYTIIPLRAANSKTLVEQSIGRGLRLPYGLRTGVPAVDTLTIVSHDKFQEIVDYANSPESSIRMGMRVVTIPQDRSKVVVAQPELFSRACESVETYAGGAKPSHEPVFATKAEAEVAKVTLDVIRRDFERLPRSQDLNKSEVKKQLIEAVKAHIAPPQPELEGVAKAVNVEAVVSKVIELANRLSIDIPRITVQPIGNVKRGYKKFKLSLGNVKLQPVENDLLIQELHRREQRRLTLGSGLIAEKRPEDYLVRGFLDLNDICYDEDSELLYDLAGQVVAHLKSYLSSEEDVVNVLQYHQQQLVNLVHSQMQDHYEEQATGYQAHVSKGFVTLTTANFSAPANAPAMDYRNVPPNKDLVPKFVFSGFQKCLYALQRFDSDSERRFAVILEQDPDILKWFRPPRDVLKIEYAGEASYEPDFVVEGKASKYLCEVKRSSELDDPEVRAKAKAAAEWCSHATKHELANGGKPWAYVLIPHDVLDSNKTVKGLASAYSFGTDRK